MSQENYEKTKPEKNKSSRRNYIVPPLPSTLWQKPLHFIAFGFGAGAFPVAPGTMGTLFAIPFFFLLQPLSLLWYCVTLIIIIIGASWISEVVSKEIKIHDHQGMCLDEIVGFLVTMIAAPPRWEWIVVGFGLFRLFDIWKPWPIRQVDEKIHGGFGMILDDVLAGVYSAVTLQFLCYVGVLSGS